MIPELDPVEVRVLGCLVEKEITTPEYYPLTANALVNACNQKSNRDPVVSYDDGTVQDALETLKAKRLLTVLTGGGNRVPKYGHRIQDSLNLGRRELALLCELMIRGPQTLGELKEHAGRMHRFSDAEEVEACLRALSDGPQPLITKLQRQAGFKEPRYAHLLSGAVAVPEDASATPDRRNSGDRISLLESEIGELRERLARVEEQLRILIG